MKNNQEKIDVIFARIYVQIDKTKPNKRMHYGSVVKISFSDSFSTLRLLGPRLPVSRRILDISPLNQFAQNQFAPKVLPMFSKMFGSVLPLLIRSGRISKTSNLNARLGMSVTTQGGSGRQYVSGSRRNLS